MVRIDETTTRAELIETLAHFTHRAKRMTIADVQYPAVHAGIDELLDALEKAPA